MPLVYSTVHLRRNPMNDLGFGHARIASSDVPARISAVPTPKKGLSPQNRHYSTSMSTSGSHSLLSVASRLLNAVRPDILLVVSALGSLLLPSPVAGADLREDLAFGRWLTPSENHDGSYSKTQLFEDDHDWLSPFW